MQLEGRQPPVRVYIIRHGETDANRQGIMQGQLDTVLNANGWAQAKAVGYALRDVHFSKAFTSDAQRASNTAKTILEYHPGVVLEERSGIRERFLGQLEGKNISVRRQPLSPSVAASMEPVEKVVARTMQWWDDEILTLVPATSTPKTTTNVLMVSHGSLINTLLLTGLLRHRGYQCSAKVVRGTLYNTAVCIVEVTGRGTGEGELVQYADISHLKELLESAVGENVDEVPLARGRKKERDTQ